MELVDLSYYQGNVNFTQLKTAVQGVILRGGDGTFQDPNLEPYAIAAKANGLPVEAYHYLRTALSPDAMAAECVRTCNRVKAAIGTYPNLFWPDMEDTSNDGMAVAARIQWLSDLFVRLDAAIPGIGDQLYTGGWYWSGRMGGTQAFKAKKLWAADYRLILTGQAGINAGWGPALYGGWTSFHTWQYSSANTRPGVAGGVDCDYRPDTGGTDMTPEESANLARVTAFVDALVASGAWSNQTENKAVAIMRVLGNLDDSAYGPMFPLLRAAAAKNAPIDTAALAKQIADLLRGTL